ncbi:MAG: tRNA (adenosine(37)-N6)-dimethylallyltransferase MiaA [Eubacteriales bacterium]|nr:tRNA (adenosine(37)-N6)-dimethylallyltransferase MiaA [Eubacteriales bacterium]
MKKPHILVVAGPTAVGKTAFAIKLANIFNGEIVSCDSMQLYKYMDIGSAKPDTRERQMAVHHLVDFLDPRDDFSVAEYQKLALETIKDIISRGKLPVISGGTGLYLNSILYDMNFADTPKNEEYRNKLKEISESDSPQTLHEMLRAADADAAELIHPNNIKKIIRALERLKEGEAQISRFSDIVAENTDFEPIMICLTRDRDELYERINVRVDKLLDDGLIDEVKRIMDMGLTPDDISMKGIGYKEIFDFLRGEISLEECVELIKKNTRHYAKRQLTWFRRYDKMEWINLSEYLNDQDALEEISRWVSRKL